jgi:hypothetical protein
MDRVHAILQESPRKRAARTRAETPALLKGLLFGPDGAAFSPTHTRKGDKLYRYYVSQTALKHGAGLCPVGRVPAGEIEAAVIDQLRAGCWQTNSNPSPLGQSGCPLCGAKPAPLGESGGTIGLEVASA